MTIQQQLQEIVKEYYKWQWTTKPSEDAGSFYPNRTNREIANWWVKHLTKIIEANK